MLCPTQPCILGNSHGLKVIIHSLRFDNPLLCMPLVGPIR